MNIVLWIVQILLALHTVTGAIWKFTNWQLVAPLVPGIPGGGWIVICVLEVLASIGLVLPLFKKQLGKATVYGAFFVAFEMTLYTVLHLASGGRDTGAMTYWLIVAVVAGLVAYARWSWMKTGSKK